MRGDQAVDNGNGENSLLWVEVAIVGKGRARQRTLTEEDSPGRRSASEMSKQRL